ncbi:hypothetical protein [Spongiimicrobium salis]|uniref:hypothetical protein n=1 Tax=Spongiimicrobium salis TaxID=1667022 RepID=UPI00374D80DF
MKRYITKIMVFGLAVSTIFSCSSDDKIVDQILEGVGTGAILRTRSETNNLVFNDVTRTFDAGSNYALTIEEQDEEEGALLESVEIFVAYRDNSGGEMTTQEVPLQTLMASDFTTGERGLPEASVSYTSDQLVSTTGITESMVVGKDRFEFRLVLNLTNGEVFSNNDVGGPVSGGSFFSAPFEYFPEVACSITESLAGTHTYVTSNIDSAPGAGGMCSGGNVMGTVTWTEVEPGEYSSSDMSFGQFEDCYTIRGPAAGEDITIVWDCTLLTPDGEVYLDEDGVVTPNDDNDDQEFTYSYTITNVTGPDMTIDFSSSAGDRGTVVITREGGADWPAIFTANN